MTKRIIKRVKHQQTKKLPGEKIATCFRKSMSLIYKELLEIKENK